MRRPRQRLLLAVAAAAAAATGICSAFVRPPNPSTPITARHHPHQLPSIVLPTVGARPLQRARQQSQQQQQQQHGHALWASRPKLGDVLHPGAAGSSKGKGSKSATTPPTPPPPTAAAEFAQAFAAEVSWASLKEKFSKQPFTRIAALLTLVAFVGYVFISPFAPGSPDLLRLDVMKQVGGLTADYFLLLPTLLPKLAPANPPVMEGVFNGLVAWAALLAFGFLEDGRKPEGKANIFLPFAAATLVLTNTAYLPWLVIRPYHDPTAEAQRPLRQADVPQVEQQLGAKSLLAFYGLAGVYSIWWTLCGRSDVLSPTLPARWASFLELASSDRLMFAFSTELGLFALFQGALVGDDARRRGLNPNGPLALAAKFVPFFGLFAYLLLRPPLPASESEPE